MNVFATVEIVKCTIKTMSCQYEGSDVTGQHVFFFLELVE